jgi:hypothetical protein
MLHPALESSPHVGMQALGACSVAEAARAPRQARARVIGPDNWANILIYNDICSSPLQLKARRSALAGAGACV